MGLFDKLKKKNEEKVDVKKSADVKVEKKEAAPKEPVKKVEEKKESKEKTVKGTSAKSTISNKILIRPLISEKAAIAEQDGVYVFVVDNRANKYQVKEAIKEVYGIMPKKVRIVNVEGKKTYAGRMQGKRSDWKKALVKMPKGKTLNIHEGV